MKVGPRSSQKSLSIGTNVLPIVVALSGEVQDKDWNQRKQTVLNLLSLFENGVLKREKLDEILRGMAQDGGYSKKQVVKIREFFLKARTCHVCSGGRVCPDCGSEDFIPVEIGQMGYRITRRCGKCDFTGLCPQCDGRGFLYCQSLDDDIAGQVREFFGGF